MKKLMFLLVVMVAISGIANANTIGIQEVTVYHQYQQTSNSPCIIGENSCSNGTFPDPTIFPPNVDSYDEVSPVYTVGYLVTRFGNSFNVGVDVNQNVGPQKLSLFEMLVEGTVVDSFTADPAILVPPTTGGGNGNGYADYLLTGFNLAGYDANDEVQFHVVMPYINDGREQYFIVSNGSPVIPEPASLLLLGSGIIGIGLVAMRRKNKR